MLRCRQMPYLHYMDDSENKKLQKNTSASLLLIFTIISLLVDAAREKEPNKRRQTMLEP
jgi:hypothetical protein